MTGCPGRGGCIDEASHCKDMLASGEYLLSVMVRIQRSAGHARVTGSIWHRGCAPAHRSCSPTSCLFRFPSAWDAQAPSPEVTVFLGTRPGYRHFLLPMIFSRHGEDPLSVSHSPSSGPSSTYAGLSWVPLSLLLEGKSFGGNYYVKFIPESHSCFPFLTCT
jgi:hypothetical protein